MKKPVFRGSIASTGSVVNLATCPKVSQKPTPSTWCSPWRLSVPCLFLWSHPSG